MKKQSKASEIGSKLPSMCVSMAQAEGIYHIPRKMLEHAKNNGCADGFDSAGRVRIVGVLKFFKPMLAKLFEGGIPSFEGFEAVDLKAELAKKAAEETRAKKRENDLAEGLIHRQEDIEEVIWEHGLKPLRDEMLAFSRKYHQLERQGGTVDPGELARDFDGITVRLRAAIPARKLESESE